MVGVVGSSPIAPTKQSSLTRGCKKSRFKRDFFCPDGGKAAIRSVACVDHHQGYCCARCCVRCL